MRARVSRTIPVFQKPLSMLVFRVRVCPGLLIEGEKLPMTDADIGCREAVFNHFAVRLLQGCEKSDIRRMKECMECAGRQQSIMS